MDVVVFLQFIFFLISVTLFIHVYFDMDFMKTILFVFVRNISRTYVYVFNDF